MGFSGGHACANVFVGLQGDVVGDFFAEAVGESSGERPFSRFGRLQGK